jgi:FkbM family methyltransferase
MSDAKPNFDFKVNQLLSKLRVNAIETLLDAYNDANMPIRNCIDGGSGAGRLTQKMAERCRGTVYAFEPFPGNHRFYTEMDGVELHKAAMAAEPGEQSFFVHSVVEADSTWAKKRGLEGYSSVGLLVTDEQAKERQAKKPEGQLLTVPCVAADDVVPEDRTVDAIKLDLQGGELESLKGMERIAPEAKFIWIEYSGQFGLAKYLTSHGYIVFDTEYLIRGAPADSTREHFAISKGDFTLSTGAKTCFGYPKYYIDGNYETWIREMKKSIKLIQTDIVAVHKTKLRQFLDAVSRIPFPILEAEETGAI